MPFDPTLPANGSANSSAEMRTQLVSLFDLIQAIPAGPQGPPFAQAVVDGVNTGNPGDAASVSVSFDGTNVHFSFSIPRGQDGVSSPPVTSFVVDSVTTLNPGDMATAQATFDGINVRLTFGIPQGNPGGIGPQGPIGEISLGQLNSTIDTTSSNSNAVATLDTPFMNEPPTLADMETLRAKMNELILALRR